MPCGIIRPTVATSKGRMQQESLLTLEWPGNGNSIDQFVARFFRGRKVQSRNGLSILADDDEDGRFQ